MKDWWQSKTVWVNALTALGSLVALPQISELISPQVLLAASGIINIILRVWFTSAPVAAVGKGAQP